MRFLFGFILGIAAGFGLTTYMTAQHDMEPDDHP